MNLKQALYVKTIAECGSLTAAAKKLYVSQPSLSQMLRYIEEELELSLFDRSTVPFRLTYAGEKYLEAAEVMLAAEARLAQQLQEIRHEESGRLRIGISVSRGMQVLPRAVPIFVNRYPHVTLELVESGSATLETMLQEGKIDLALAAIESTSSNITYELLEKETVGILAGKDSHIASRFSSGTPVHLEDAKDDPFVVLQVGHSARVIQDKLLRRASFEPRVILEINSLEIGKRVALNAGACMILPSLYIDDYVYNKRGEFFPLADYENHRHFYACYRKDAFIPRYMQDFIGIVQAVLEDPIPFEKLNH